VRVCERNVKNVKNLKTLKTLKNVKSETVSVKSETVKNVKNLKNVNLKKRCDFSQMQSANKNSTPHHFLATLFFFRNSQTKNEFIQRRRRNDLQQLP